MKLLSVAIAVYNEAKNLDACLSSVADWVDEIVVVDGGSTDATVAVAKKYKVQIIQTDNPPIFHINKQKALDACTGKWVLQLDADEIIPLDLREEILGIVKSDGLPFAGYFIPRKNFFLGHWMQKGGQYPDEVIRLFLRDKGKFPSQSVHEQIAIDGAVGHLTHPMEHYSYHTLAEYMTKAKRYSRLVGADLRRGTTPLIVLGIQYLLVKPVITFFQLFVRHKGFMDGMYGLLYSVLSAGHHPMALYFMLYEKK